VTAQISTIELNSELTNLAYEMGLNVSEICETLSALRRPYPVFPRLLGSAETIALLTKSLTTSQASRLEYN
jgi:hypothetical protein